MVELVVEVVFVLLVLLDEELVDVVDDNVLEEDELDDVDGRACSRGRVCTACAT